MHLIRITCLLLCCCWFTQGNAQCPPASDLGVHVVQQGQTLFGIAKQYNMTLKQLRDWNNMLPNDGIYPCDELYVSIQVPDVLSRSVTPAPAPTTFSSGVMTPRGVNATTATGQRQSGGVHVVQVGESIAQLARLYGYTEERFREFNGLPSWGGSLNVGAALRSSECNCSDTAPRSNAVTSAVGNPAPTTFSRNPAITENVISGFTPRSGTITPAPTTFSRNVTIGNAAPTTNRAVDDRSFLQTDESQMIDEINLLRANPAAYVPYIQSFVRNYPTKFRRQIDSRYVNSLISTLLNTRPLSQLMANSCLYQVAVDHGNYQRSINAMTHDGPGNEQPHQRTQRYCPTMQTGASSRPDGMLVGNENLVAGHSSARDAVISLLIDEGLQIPGHRLTLLAPEWRYVATRNYGTVGGYPHSYLQLFGR